MSLSFLDLKLGIRTDRIEILLYYILTFQKFFLHKESVALLSGILFDTFGHNVQCFLFAIWLNAFSHIGILESDRYCNMHVAVNDSRHDELSTEIGNISIIIRKS